MDEKFFTPDQVSQILQVHPYTVLKFIRQGKLRAVKLGRVYRIKQSDVETFLEEAQTLKGKKPSSHPSNEADNEKGLEIRNKGTSSKEGNDATPEPKNGSEAEPYTLIVKEHKKETQSDHYIIGGRSG